MREGGRNREFSMENKTHYEGSDCMQDNIMDMCEYLAWNKMKIVRCLH